VTKGKNVEDKQKGTQNGTLGDTMCDWGGYGFAVIDGNEVESV